MFCQALKYALASGQEISLLMSTMVFSKNTPLEIRYLLPQILYVRIANKHDKYLGLPSIVGFLRERSSHQFWSRLHGWNSKLLSQGGREVLIKVVLNVIPSYANSGLPTFGGVLTIDRKVHWVVWNKLCTQKEVGGMGSFRQLKAFNLALLAKQGWWIFSQPQSLLSRIYKAKYFPNTYFLEANLGPRPSYTQRSIFALQVCVGFWDADLIKSVFMLEDAQYILSIPLGSGRNSDFKIWHFTKNGRFFVRSLYHLAIDLVLLGSASSSSTRACTSSFQDWNFIYGKQLYLRKFGFLVGRYAIMRYLLRRLWQEDTCELRYVVLFVLNQNIFTYYYTVLLPVQVWAEALAAREALEMAREQGWRKIILEGDLVDPALTRFFTH
ncbi:hypothetical protein Pfo_003723 [Paulownia fortunei]|nr:hypothetical protein Pfo_003723 [Paulownia fortunei]